MNDQRRTMLINNVRVFDSRTGTLGAPGAVEIDGNRILRVAAPSERSDTAQVEVIDGGGRVVIPGLIDAHWHSSFAAVPLPVIMQADPNYVQLVSGQAAGATLLRGFTTVRDAGGPALGLKSAIDSGVLPGPRMYPSGAMISQTGGHGDFRTRGEIPRGRLGHLGHADLLGATAIADGTAEVLRASREQLMLGATQLKLMAGGGAASIYDPLDVTQYTEAELGAAVEAAANWGTYVMVHAYTPRAVQGVARRCREHRTRTSAGRKDGRADG